MQGKRLLLANIIGLTAIISATQAMAVMSVPMGWYIEGNGGVTRISDKNYGPGSSSKTNGWGFNVNAGYKFMPYFAAEGGYTRYKDSSIYDQYGNKAGTDTHYSFDIVFRGILPAADTGFEAFAKIGGERTNSKISIVDNVPANNIGLVAGSHNATGIYVGAGGQYYFMPEIAIVLQWQRAVGNSTTGILDLWSAGLSFIFD